MLNLWNGRVGIPCQEQGTEGSGRPSQLNGLIKSKVSLIHGRIWGHFRNGCSEDMDMVFDSGKNGRKLINSLIFIRNSTIHPLLSHPTLITLQIETRYKSKQRISFPPLYTVKIDNLVRNSSFIQNWERSFDGRS